MGGETKRDRQKEKQRLRKRNRETDRNRNKREKENKRGGKGIIRNMNILQVVQYVEVIPVTTVPRSDVLASSQCGNSIHSDIVLYPPSSPILY